MVISPAGAYKIDVPGAWRVSPLAADQNKLIVSTYSGFSILKKENGRWNYSHKAPDFIDSCRGFIEDEENYTFWVVNTNSQIQKISYDAAFSRMLNRKLYTIKNARFDANNIFRKIDNNLVVCTTNGIYQYSRITDSFDRYPQLESMLDGPRYYEFLYADVYKNIWFVSDKQLKMLPYQNGYKGYYNWGGWQMN